MEVMDTSIANVALRHMAGSVAASQDESTWAQSHYLLVSPTMTWPIFDAGRIVSNITLQKANTEEAVLQYRKAVLVALQEVEDALVAYATEQARHRAVEESLKQSQDALNISQEQYRKGLTTFSDVLDAERSVFTAEDALAQSDETMSTNLVAVYKALEGG